MSERTGSAIASASKTVKELVNYLLDMYVSWPNQLHSQHEVNSLTCLQCPCSIVAHEAQVEHGIGRAMRRALPGGGSLGGEVALVAESSPENEHENIYSSAPSFPLAFTFIRCELM